jgi:Thioesterase superfamily
MTDIPDGFAPHFRKSPLTDPWEPLYSKVTDTSVIIGMRAGAQHCNARIPISCAKQHDPAVGVVTISLNLEFLKAAKKGQWLEFITSFTKIGRSVDFAQGHVEADGERCAIVSASFAVPQTAQ